MGPLRGLEHSALKPARSGAFSFKPDWFSGVIVAELSSFKRLDLVNTKQFEILDFDLIRPIVFTKVRAPQNVLTRSTMLSNYRVITAAALLLTTTIAFDTCPALSSTCLVTVNPTPSDAQMRALNWSADSSDMVEREQSLTNATVGREATKVPVGRRRGLLQCGGPGRLS